MLVTNVVAVTSLSTSIVDCSFIKICIEDTKFTNALQKSAITATNGHRIYYGMLRFISKYGCAVNTATIAHMIDGYLDNTNKNIRTLKNTSVGGIVMNLLNTLCRETDMRKSAIEQLSVFKLYCDYYNIEMSL